jgi:hypothetical protein
LKAVREKKQITYKGKPTKITADFSVKTLKVRRAWGEIFWALNENNFQSRILYPEKLSLKIDRGINIFHDKQKLKQYMIPTNHYRIYYKKFCTQKIKVKKKKTIKT